MDRTGAYGADMALWAADEPGVLTLPSGRRVRGRALRRPLPAGPDPQYGLYLLGRGTSAPRVDWPADVLRWPDFGLPTDRLAADRLLRTLWQRADQQRVEVACGGGRGRTGTALAVLAVLDGVPPADAVQWVRARHHRRAVETPWQRRWVRDRR